VPRGRTAQVSSSSPFLLRHYQRLNARIVHNFVCSAPPGVLPPTVAMEYDLSEVPGGEDAGVCLHAAWQHSTSRARAAAKKPQLLRPRLAQCLRHWPLLGGPVVVVLAFVTLVNSQLNLKGWRE